MTSEPIIAILDQLAEQAEQIARLDAREAASTAEANRRIADLAVLASSLDSQVAELAAQIRRHVPAGVAAGVQELAGRAAPGGRWWKVPEADRDEAISALGTWVDEVYRPGYGQIAANLGPCWDQHALCLYALDILAELWTVLYLAGEENPAVLSAQAEYQARILPALAEQMASETNRCRHARQRLAAPGPVRRSS